MIELLKCRPSDLAGDLASGVHTLLRKEFLDDAPAETDYYCFHGPPALVLVLHEGPKLIGHLAVYERQVLIGNEVLQTGMIGGVTVAPEHRQQGHSRVLVIHAHEYLKSRHIPFSILFAHEPLVYRSAGYKLMQNPTRFVDIDGTSKTVVYRGSMYAELLQRRWPDQLLDLCGRVV